MHFPREGGFRFTVHGILRQPALEHGNSLLPLIGAVGDFRIIGLVEEASAEAKGDIPCFVQAYKLTRKVIGITVAQRQANFPFCVVLLARDKCEQEKSKSCG